jgi:hypothetical protein
VPQLVEQSAWTDAVLAMLQTTGQAIGDMELLEVPANKPWAILYELPGTQLSGPWGDPEADAWMRWQVTSVGYTRKQAGMMRDLVRRTMIKRNGVGGWAVPLVPPVGWVVVARVMEEPGGGIDQAGPAGNRTFTAVDRFSINVTPST